MNVPILIKRLKKHSVIKDIHQLSQETVTPVYLVGGAVRDLVMGIFPEKDFDFVIAHSPEKFARLFSRVVSGSIFTLSSNPPNYRVVFYRDNERIDVDFSEFRGDDINEDLIHRDFTVNAMAVLIDELFEKEGLKLYDPLKGEKDIDQRTLRITSFHSFDDDPLRILRAVRIAKARNFLIDSSTKDEISRKRENLASVAPERIRTEFFKTISFAGAAESFSFFHELKLLSFLLPEITTCKISKRGSDQRETPWELALKRVSWCEWVMQNLNKIFSKSQNYLGFHFAQEVEADVERHSLLKLGCFLHNFNIIEKNQNQNSVVSPSGNQDRLIEFSDRIAGRFKLGRKAKGTLRALLTKHNRIFRLFQVKEVKERAFCQFFLELGGDGLDLLVLCWADFVSCSPERFGSDLDLKIRGFLSRLANYYVNEFLKNPPLPLISGSDIIQNFGLKEGKIIGVLLNQVRQAEAESTISSRKEALLYVENLIKNTTMEKLN